MVYSQNELWHSKENEGTTTAHKSTDEFHKRDVEQKVARYKTVSVILIYTHPYKAQKQVRLIYGEVKSTIIPEQVSGGKSSWDRFGEMFHLGKWSGCWLHECVQSEKWHQAVFLGFVFFSVNMSCFNKKFKKHILWVPTTSLQPYAAGVGDSPTRSSCQQAVVLESSHTEDRCSP